MTMAVWKQKGTELEASWQAVIKRYDGRPPWHWRMFRAVLGQVLVWGGRK